MGEMTEYERGQRDMRNRIERQWRGWSMDGIGSYVRAQKGVGDVPLMIRKQNPIRNAGRALLTATNDEGGNHGGGNR